MVYDFIVVGSGPAGSSLASRLAKSKKAPHVLLLEAGQGHDASNPNLLAERWSSFMKYPQSNWGYNTVPQKFADDREINYARGKGLGGSTLINMCAWTVGPKDDYDRWAEEVGDDAFSWENAVRLRKKMESYDQDISDDYRPYARPDMTTHGTDGPIRIEYPKILERPIVMHMDVAKESGLGNNLDANNGNPLGLGVTPSSSRRGKRITAAVAYLSDVPENLHIITDAPVMKIVFEGKKAVGVIAQGQEYRAKNDVVLSAGAVDSPKLLMLSGVGDSKHLTDHGIDTIHDLPAVGQNLEDHFFSIGTWRQNANPFDSANGQKRAKDAHSHPEQEGSEPLSAFFQAVATGFFKADEVLDTKAFRSLPANVQAHIRKPTVPMWEISAHLPPLNPAADPSQHYLTMALFLHNPASRGTIRLASSDPTAPPLIDPNFLSHPFDELAAKVAAARLRDYLATPKIASTLVPDEKPLSTPGDDDDSALAWWRASGMSSYHPSCTVKMGRKGDPEAGTDSDFKVVGLQNLRVVDMSVAPFLPNCHIVAVAYLLGEIAAEKIIEEYGLDA